VLTGYAADDDLAVVDEGPAGAVDDEPAADDEAGAAGVVAGAVALVVEAGAATAVAAQEQTAAAEEMTWMPVTAPQVASTQPWAAFWMAAEEAEPHWHL